MKLLAVSDGPGYISVLQKMPSLGCFGIFFLFFFFPLKRGRGRRKTTPFPSTRTAAPPNIHNRVTDTGQTLLNLGPSSFLKDAPMGGSRRKV